MVFNLDVLRSEVRWSKAGAFLTDDAGQGLVEYALVITMVALVAIGALRTLGRKTNNTFNNAAGSLS
jgi:Flp pilus assembly pilin Flp